MVSDNYASEQLTPGRQIKKRPIPLKARSWLQTPLVSHPADKSYKYVLMLVEGRENEQSCEEKLDFSLKWLLSITVKNYLPRLWWKVLDICQAAR